MRLSDMLEKQGELLKEIRAISDKEKPTAEDNLRFDEVCARLDELNDDIAKKRIADAAAKRSGGEALRNDEFGNLASDAGIQGAIQAQLGMDTWKAGAAREVSKELENRTGRKAKGLFVPTETRAVATTGSGSNLVATDHLDNNFIETLKARMVVRQAGARILRGLEGDVSIPKMSASVAASWVAENGALSAADPTLTAVTMSPKHAGMITEYSRNMIQQSSPDIEQILRMDFAQTLARAVDEVALDGTGSNEPEGIKKGYNDGDITGVSLNSLTWANVLELIETIEVANAEANAFITRPEVVTKLRSTAKVSGSAEYGFIMEGAKTLADYPLFSTTNVPNTGGSPDASYLYFGNWSDLLIGFWSELDVLVNPYESTAYTKGNAQIRAMLTCDVARRHDASFVVGDDVQIN